MALPQSASQQGHGSSDSEAPPPNPGAPTTIFDDDADDDERRQCKGICRTGSQCKNHIKAYSWRVKGVRFCYYHEYQAEDPLVRALAANRRLSARLAAASLGSEGENLHQSRDEEVIKDLEAKLAAANQTVANLRQSRDEEVRDLRARLVAADQATGDLRESRDEEVRDLKARLAAADQTAANLLRQSRDEEATANRNLLVRVAAAERTAVSLRSERARLERRLEASEREKAELARKNAELARKNVEGDRTTREALEVEASELLRGEQQESSARALQEAAEGAGKTEKKKTPSAVAERLKSKLRVMWRGA
ncbi:uncharacterized protein LTHEOB_11320 [Lasiodiplodia theobromae]|uniref:uncharacterized protein n=1 Tax=Lasiodiplodia theobromae TaxID=45133 RepID=UPI0015C3ED48|nr:uncharacterized protein LTHEOB_11320 [Lasiodiplodia theobromae]KAF4537836.1 hypothetical protein LTHEOB_11320 [Lasiodiplodia theobromae]